MMTDEPRGAPEARRRLSRAEARQQTRERLLAAAADVFKRFGYNGTSLEAVAEAAGYTKGAVYSNFATKADLFMTLLDAYVEAESEAQRRQFADLPLDAFVDALEALFQRQVVQDPDWVILQIEFWLAAVRDPAIRARLLEGAEEHRATTGATIDAKLAAGGISGPFSGREIGILLNAMATGFAIQWQLDPASVDPKLLVRAARRIVGLDDTGGPPPDDTGGPPAAGEPST
jgi:AcrR family transcriptional regulator